MSTAATVVEEESSAPHCHITHLLCPELSLQQIDEIRKRVVETVMMERGRGKKRKAQVSEVVKANRSSIHKKLKEAFKKCKMCGNIDQGGGEFVTDIKNGDVICTQCGTVESESFIHEGEMYRRFEGEEDRNHHGNVIDPLFSYSYNMATSLSGIRMGVGGGLGSGTKGRRNFEGLLKKAHNYIEMNVAEMGDDEKKTRIAYKDKQKKEAFGRMKHVVDALSLNQAVLQRAKELFSAFRDDRELLKQLEGVIAACLCEAFDQLSNEGGEALNMQATTGEVEDDSENNVGRSNGNNLRLKQLKFSARAKRRNELHSSNLAAKHSLMLNFHQQNLMEINKENKSNNIFNKPKTTSKFSTPRSHTTSAIEEKLVSLWDLHDIRTWLLEASSTISRKWLDQQNEIAKANQSVESMTKDDMEGRLMQYIFKLCDVLQNEVVTNKESTTQCKRRVLTRKVNEMGPLSIKWQHGHERGSGGAGGIGFSGISVTSVAQRGRGGGNGKTTTAGQILMMKTAPQLKKAIGDNDAGEEFYKELRALVGRQNTKTKQQRRKEASVRRMNQMRRKLELRIRVQS